MTVRRSLPADVKRPSSQQVRRKLRQSNTLDGFQMRPGFLYTVVRAISARVNQNYDGWPADELKRATHTFVGKPVFVNHENHDPTLARGRVVAARYVENGNDRYVEVVQEIDAERFPRLAHEIRTGALDSVSMGAEAGFTICSYCSNKATDMADMCDHVLHHKGEKLRREGKNGQAEEVLVYESCHDIKFFELSYVFDPADETAVVSKVVQAGKYTKDDFADGKKPWEKNDDDEDDTKTAGVAEDYTDMFFGEPGGSTATELPPESLADRYMDEMYNEDMHLDGPRVTAALRRTAKVNWLIDPKEFDPNKPVHVHTMRHHVKRGVPEIWSIGQKGPNGPRVIAYADEVPMRDVKFRVQPGGHKLYQETMDPETGEGGDRVVHAWADGYWVPEMPGDLQNESPVDYHPKKQPNFYHVDDDSPVNEAAFVHFRPDKKVLAYSPDNWGRPARVAALEPHPQDIAHYYATLRRRAQATLRRMARIRTAGQAATPEYNRAVAEQLIGWFDGKKPHEGVGDFMAQFATNPDEVGNARPYVEQMGRTDVYPTLLKIQEQLRAASRRQAYGEIEAPEDVDTLRQETPEENDFQHYLEPPEELQEPDLDQSKRLDREQEQEGLDVDRRAEDAEEVLPGQQTPMQPQQQQDPQTLTLNLPLPQAGRKLARAWQAALDADRPFTAAEESLFEAYLHHSPVKTAQDYAQEMNTQQKGQKMGSSLAERGKTASRDRRRHHADMSRNDQGVQEEVFITQTPPEEAVVAPADDATNITNTPANLVARIKAASESLKRDLATYQAMSRVAEGDTPVYADVADPALSGTDDQDVTDGSFINVDPNADVVPTQPKDASVHAFAAFDRWLTQVAGRRVAGLTSTDIRRAASRYAKETHTPIEALFPTLGTVLRAARKTEAASTHTRRDTMAKRTADTSLDVAAPDGRVDVEAPVSNTTDDQAQASQYEIGDYGQNAGDSIADPDLSTTQNFAPGEAPRSAKKADGVLAVRCAEAYIKAGLASEGDKWKLAGQFQTMNRGLVQSHVALLERVASVHTAQLAKVASGRTRGTGSRLPQGLTTAPGMTRSAGMTRQALNDPSFDFTLFTG